MSSTLAGSPSLSSTMAPKFRLSVEITFTGAMILAREKAWAVSLFPAPTGSMAIRGQATRANATSLRMKGSLVRTSGRGEALASRNMLGDLEARGDSS